MATSTKKALDSIMHYAATVPSNLRSTAGATVLGLAALLGGNAEAGQAPTANKDSYLVPENTPVELTVLANDANATDIGQVGAPARGQAARAVRPDGSFVVRYTPAAMQVGQNTQQDGFVYEATNPSGTALAPVEITQVRAHVSADDDVSMTQGQTIEIPVLANDVSPAGRPLRIASTGGSSLATPNLVEIVSDGTRIRYTATNLGDTPQFGTMDVIQLQILDDAGNETISQLTIGINGLPRATDVESSVNKRHSVTIPFAAQDPEGQALAFAIGTPIDQDNGDAGSAAIVGNSIVYTAGTKKGIKVLPWETTDPQGARANALALINVTGTPPTSVTVEKQGRETETIAFSVSELAGDVDGDRLTLEGIVSSGDKLAVSISDDKQTLFVTGARGYIGADQNVVVTVADEDGTCQSIAHPIYNAWDASSFTRTPTQQHLNDVIAAGGKLLTKSKDGRIAVYSMADASLPGKMTATAALRKKVKGEDLTKDKEAKRIYVTFDGKPYMMIGQDGSINLANPNGDAQEFGLTLAEPRHTYGTLDLIKGTHAPFTQEAQPQIYSITFKPAKGRGVPQEAVGLPQAVIKYAKSGAIQRAATVYVGAGTGIDVTRQMKAQKSLMLQQPHLPVVVVQGEFAGPQKNDLTSFSYDEAAQVQPAQWSQYEAGLTSVVSRLSQQRDEMANQNLVSGLDSTIKEAQWIKIAKLNGRGWMDLQNVTASDYDMSMSQTGGGVEQKWGPLYKSNYTTPPTLQADTGVAVKAGSRFRSKTSHSPN